MLPSRRTVLSSMASMKAVSMIILRSFVKDFWLYNTFRLDTTLNFPPLPFYSSNHLYLIWYFTFFFFFTVDCFMKSRSFNLLFIRHWYILYNRKSFLLYKISQLHKKLFVFACIFLLLWNKWNSDCSDTMNLRINLSFSLCVQLPVQMTVVL